MPVQQLKDFLESQGTNYACIDHPPAFTAQELAHHCKIKGDQVVKTVIIELDGAMTMLVLPATWRIRWDRLGKILDTDFVDLADEAEFKDCFPNCEVGAMPPFGNLYGMHVYCCETLTAQPELVFAAGNHSESIRMATADFLRLVNPILIGQGFNKPGQAKPAWLSGRTKAAVAQQEAR
jgi:Ala-tRNA(Pro) deacylase